MKFIFYSLAFAWLILLSGCDSKDKTATPETSKVSSLQYPISVKGDVVDDYHGTKVSDPYRWLEDEQSSQQQAWIEQQRKLADDYLITIKGRKDLHRRLKQLWNYEKITIPKEYGNRWFIYKNNGLQNQSVLYSMADLDGNDLQVVIDPNKLSEDGTVALSGVSISKNGKYLAYGTSASGSDWQQWQVKDLSSGKKMDDILKWVKFSSASWTKDNKGFFYSRYDEPKTEQALSGANYFQKLYYHRLGTSQSEDKLIYQRPDHKDWGISGSVSNDGRYLIISVWQGTDSRNRLFYKDLTQENSAVVELISELEASYKFIGNKANTFYLQTNLNAAMGKVIAINLQQPNKQNWKTIVAESSNALQSSDINYGMLTLRYLKHAITQIELYDLEGKHKASVNMPGLGTASNLTGDEHSDIAFISFESYLQPTSIYQYDFENNSLKLYQQPEVKFNPKDYVSKQVFYKSKDGTQVPMIISHKKDLKINGETPTLLYGYGGFNIPMTPRFRVMTLAWMEKGGIYAVANIRGGSEYGEDWHLAGSLHQKQNTFDDFIAAAEWLIGNNYTSKEQLGIYGRSNGGLLVGAVMTQRPNLFAAALPAVGVLDMLRFHKFTIGWAWTSDYGSSDNAEDFKVLYSYSPYHNLKPATEYPATMVMTADHDDRVVPYHSFKFAARLQEYNSSGKPTIIRIEHKAGHGAGKPTSKKIEDARDIIAFLAQHTGLAL